jgi:hypothetical protein
MHAIKKRPTRASVTDEFIQKEHARLWAEHPEEYPSFETVSSINEYIRALYVIKSVGTSMTLEAAMSLYMVRQDTTEMVLSVFSQPEAGKTISAPTRGHRAGKREYAFQYAAENAGKEMKTADIAAAIGVSYPTMLKIIESRPDLFRRVGHGIYSLRDSMADRQKEKENNA